jgi:hypothetical protein
VRSEMRRLWGVLHPGARTSSPRTLAYATQASGAAPAMPVAAADLPR